MKQYKKIVKDSTIVLSQIGSTDRYNGSIETETSVIYNPTEKELIENGWKEVMQPTPPPYVPPTEEEIKKLELEYYESRVVSEIRKKYTLEQELAIQRLRTTKELEFNEYNTYCELCKTRVKLLIELEKKEQESFNIK